MNREKQQLKNKEIQLIVLFFPVLILASWVPEQFFPDIYETVLPALIVIMAELPILYQFDTIRKRLHE